MEIFLGFNLNAAVVRDGCVADKAGNGCYTLALDGGEQANPAARREAPAGRYTLTRTDGKAPGEVRYWGVAA